ncbi:cytohesin-3 isoform X2 [Denticeps clupeoides]|uniref:cytohesin-3 isoform X2 n=1 Tax=Denticeps clupeoides TaxID=299321 RepID=UPI0010A4E0D1|nr:cytohesin-3-like isoform X2 [Denticeps clupeoides]
MGSQRKDSFLWGKAPTDLTSLEKKEIGMIRGIRKNNIMDDIQLKLEISSVITEIEDMESDEENTTVLRSKRFLCGKKKFNMEPKKGIQYLLDNAILEWTPQAVAEFLYKEEGLNKTAIGIFLGEREELHLQILKAFVALHEFSNLNLVQALRQFLWNFRLPGEAQKIDRMMEAFAARYCNCNPGVFQSTDTCYILSFAIIMLNTSLHNPNVRDKPTLERFISMNRGINHGEDLPSELLTKLYDSIRNEPFTIPEDDGNDLTHTFFNPDREGWLLKEGGRVKTWKRRWFILTDNCLYYFQYTTDKEPKGIIPLENLCVTVVDDPHKQVHICNAASSIYKCRYKNNSGCICVLQYCLELFNPQGKKIKACKTETDGRVVVGKHQSYRISASSAEERDDWINSIRSDTSFTQKRPLGRHCSHSAYVVQTLLTRYRHSPDSRDTEPTQG